MAKINSWEELVNDGENYGKADLSPLEKILVESIKNRTILKIQDRFLFSKTGEVDPDHGVRLAELIANFEPLKEIESLILTHNDLGPEGVAILSESPVLTQINDLHLGSSQLKDEGARILAQSGQWENLSYLNLECNGIGLEGARALANSPHLRKLTSLNLVDNRLGDEGVMTVVESEIVSCLTYLHLGGNRLKNSATKKNVQESPRLAHIKTLKIF
tara:strand:- start:1697 stop:2347 length:651 start_codon:yes stop_codon:yes gene_type:complete